MGDDRERWIAILESVACSRPDKIDGEWSWLLEQLGLPNDYFLGVLEAIQQGRWRFAKNPRSYIKTVARREGAKMGLRPDHSEKLLPSVALEAIAHISATSEATKGQDGIWKQGRGWDDEYNDPRYGISFREYLLNRVPQELKEITEPSESYKALLDQINRNTNEFHLHASPSITAKWDKWAESAGFDDWDRLVLQHKLKGVSRERALEAQMDERSRKALQAAWKKFDRTGTRRLQKALKNFA
jgi:hypothetical protein